MSQNLALVSFDSQGDLLHEDDKEKMPWKSVLAVATSVFTFAFSALLVEPIIPFMTQDFIPDLDIKEIG